MKLILIAATATLALASGALAAPQSSMNATQNSAKSGTTLGYVSFVNPAKDTVLVANQPFKVSSAEISKLKLGDKVVIKPDSSSMTAANDKNGTAIPATVVSVTG